MLSCGFLAQVILNREMYGNFRRDLNWKVMTLDDIHWSCREERGQHIILMPRSSILEQLVGLEGATCFLISCDFLVGQGILSDGITISLDRLSTQPGRARVLNHGKLVD